jgi:hypothetical protein
MRSLLFALALVCLPIALAAQTNFMLRCNQVAYKEQEPQINRVNFYCKLAKTVMAYRPQRIPFKFTLKPSLAGSLSELLNDEPVGLKLTKAMKYDARLKIYTKKNYRISKIDFLIRAQVNGIQLTGNMLSFSILFKPF